MKKFQFKFQTVLKVKEQKEEELKRELMRLQALKLEQQMLLAEIENEKRASHKEKSKHHHSGTDISLLRQFEEYINALRSQVALTEKRIKDLEKKADIKRVEVVEASKEKKVLEKLKDRDFAEFKKVVLKNEQDVLDEIAISKYNRKEQKSF